MKTIGKILHKDDYPLKIFDDHGNIIYSETSDGFWWLREFDSKGTLIYLEYSTGQIVDMR